MNALGDIASFIEVVQTGSFTAAAERLGASKSIVSKHVSRLEERLGARLLNRTTRRLSLTEVGALFYARAQLGLDELAEAEAVVSRLQAAPRGTLKLNVPMSFGVVHIAPVMRDFLTRYPELQLDMRLDDRKLDLVEEGFDVAIRIADLADSSLVAVRLGTCRHVVCASPAYLQTFGEPITPDELRNHNALSFSYQDSPTQWQFTATDGRRMEVPVFGNLRINNSLALREALLAGAGIALTPSFVVGPDLRAGLLRTVLTDYRLREVPIHAVYPQRRHLSPKVKAFIEFMAEHLARQPDLKG